MSARKTTMATGVALDDNIDFVDEQGNEITVKCVSGKGRGSSTSAHALMEVESISHFAFIPSPTELIKSESCGLSVAISLADMHECGATRVLIKKPRTQLRSATGEEYRVETSEDFARFQDQPRSAFRLFMEEFAKTCPDGDEIDVDRRGFETWRNMSKMERQPYELRAEKIYSAYLKGLIEEENNMPKVNDEAESVEVKNYEEVCLHNSSQVFLTIS
ncbi:unnamed protein product [Cuscuta campestris]|uniref:HMG box domain-containing protein n=1 Tax=Cuscuta campestris TaxID=132261 RepID=A0A484LMA5_9ASTE|nr:unnamed protein product [Cuscuta campestris]